MSKSARRTRKRSTKEKAECAKKIERTRLTACVRLFHRIPRAINGAAVAAPSLYPLEVSANNGSLPPPGVCAAAIAAAETPVTVQLPTDQATVINNALDTVLATRYKQYVRCNTDKVPTDTQFDDYQIELYCDLTKIAFSTYAEIALQIAHDGWDAATIFAGMLGASPDDTRCLAVAAESLLTARTRSTVSHKTAEKAGELDRHSGPVNTTIVTGPEPMVVWPERVVLGQERISVSNHAQKGLNQGMTFYLEQQWKAMRWSGVPTMTANGELFRDECDEHSNEPPASTEATHLGHNERNCYSHSEQTQRMKFLSLCNEIDSDSGMQYTPTSNWNHLFVCQRPSGHGQTWLNTKLAGMLFLITHDHPTGGGISLDEIHWHVQRSGAASDTGDFPKATTKPIKFLFVQLLYAIVSHMEPDQTSAQAAKHWVEFQSWCRNANKNRQKEQNHHIIFYLWKQLLLRGDNYLKLRIVPDKARAVIEPHKPYIVDDWGSKISNSDLVAVFATNEPPETGCTHLQTRCKLHQSLQIMCGMQFVTSICGVILYSRVRSAIREACRIATHPLTELWTLCDVVLHALRCIPIPLHSNAWKLCEEHVRAACGAVLLPGFSTHPVFEIAFHELTRITTPTDTLSDIVDVWPAVPGEVQLKIFYANPTTVVLAHEKIEFADFTEAPDVLVHVRSASCAVDTYTSIILSVPDNALVPDNLEVDENYILQTLCNSDNHAGCVSLRANVTKRTSCELSVAHDVMCNPFLHMPPRPETSTTTKVPLLLSDVCAGGITDWSWRSEPIDWQFTVVLFAPTVGPRGSVTHIFYMVFDCSDKQIKLFAATPVKTEIVMAQINPADDIQKRRADMLAYAQTTAFVTAVPWVPLRATKTVDAVAALQDKAELHSRWDKIRACDTKVYYGPFVEGETNVTGLLVTLLQPARVHPDALYEGVLQWGACYKTVLGLALGRGDESLWSFITKKELQLRTVSSKFAVASSGLKRLQAASNQLMERRLGECDTLQDLCFFGDSDDQFELLMRREKSIDLKRKADQAALTMMQLCGDSKKEKLH